MRGKWLHALAMAAALAVAACGGSASSGAPAGTATDSAPSVLNIGFPNKPITLDPDLALDTTSLAAVHLIAGTLYEIRADGQTVPGLATDGTPSADGLEWTFALRDGLTFSDGTPLTSADVKATIDRAMSDEANLYIGLFAPIASVEAPSPTQVVIKLNSPYYSLPTILAEPCMMIMPAAGMAKGQSFFDAPVSAGPYKLTSWGGGDNASFALNDSYWGPMPVVPVVNFATVIDYNTRVAQVRSGQLDMAVDLPPSLLPQLDGDGMTGKLVPVYGFISIVPNNQRAPFDNVKVRQAISMALDRDKINEVVWGGRNNVIAGFWPSTYPGYDSSIPTAQDLGGAKAALVGTPCADGCSASLAYNTGVGWTDQTALLVQDNLESIGIHATIQKVENAAFLDRIFKGDFDIIVSYLYDYVSIPDGLLAYGALQAGGLNAQYTGYDAPAMIEAAKAVVEADPASRAPLLAETERIWAEDLPYVNISDYAMVIASRQPDTIVTLSAAAFIEVGRAPAQ